MPMKRIPAASLLTSILLVFCQLSAQGHPPKKTKVPPDPYIWKSVQIVGGGFVDGIVFHSTEKGLCYCRTDIGGAYRRDPRTMRWEPLLDWISFDDLNLMGVESMALDPSDPDRVYFACGTYTNPDTPDGAVLRSDDRGKTFKRTNVPFKFGGNENGRGNGERMTVDPNDGNIIYLGTRHTGLWKSTDRAVTWKRVESFPDVTEYPPSAIQSQDSIRFWRWQNQGSGIVFVIFDGRSGSNGKGSSTVFAGVSIVNRNNFFRSTDAGITWHPVPGQPTQYRPNHAVLTSNGTMYLSYGSSPGPSRMNNGGIWKLNTKNGAWTEITPLKPDSGKKGFGYAAVSVDAHDPNAIIASSFGRFSASGEDDIFRSTDGGKSWRAIFAGGGTYDFSLAPYVAQTPIHWLFDIEIDPSNPNHAMFTTGYGGYETFDLTDADAGKPTKWSVMSSGIEETVALDLLSPPKGAHLVSAIGDYSGFVHWDLDKPSPEGHFDNPRFGNTTALACAENNPDVIVRVGNISHHKPGLPIGYSLAGGKTWQPTASVPNPESKLGSLAVSSDGTFWVWSPDPIYSFGHAPQPTSVWLTTDRGSTWTQCHGIPPNTRVVADRVNPKYFYAMDLFGGKFFISSDGGVHFAEQPLALGTELPRQRGNRGDSRGGQDRLYAVPNREGDLWIAAFDGLYHSTDRGKAFSRIEGIKEIQGFGFGKSAPGTDYAALYQVGIDQGVRGIFRSDDVGRTWVRINDDRHQWGLVLQVTGDPRLYGRVYVGTHGRGILYGDPTE
jgi:hypothetical protein